MAWFMNDYECASQFLDNNDRHDQWSLVHNASVPGSATARMVAESWSFAGIPCIDSWSPKSSWFHVAFRARWWQWPLGKWHKRGGPWGISLLGAKIWAFLKTNWERFHGLPEWWTRLRMIKSLEIWRTYFVLQPTVVFVKIISQKHDPSAIRGGINFEDVYVNPTVKKVKPSAYEVRPACPHYNSCGGCDFLDLTYGRQLIEKRRWIERALNGSKVPLESLKRSGWILWSVSGEWLPLPYLL